MVDMNGSAKTCFAVSASMLAVLAMLAHGCSDDPAPAPAAAAAAAGAGGETGSAGVGGEAGAGGGDSAVTRSALILAACNARNACCSSAGKSNDRAKCVAELEALPAAKYPLPYNAAKCLAMMKERTKDGSYCSLGLTEDGTFPCRDVLPFSSSDKPPAPLGAACFDGGDCGFTEGTEPGCAQGSGGKVCVEVVEAKEGEACRFSEDRMGWLVGSASGDTTPSGVCRWRQGLWCAPEGTCKKHVTGDEKCGLRDEACLSERCDSNKCKAVPALGASCAEDFLSPCEPGAVCLNKKCSKLKLDGESCLSDKYCLSYQCSDGVCAGLAQPSRCTSE